MSTVELNTHIPHSARIYDYMLGGKDNFDADRRAAESIMNAAPNLATSMRANRTFMARVAHYLAAEVGIRQFLDVGTGLPTAPNLHEVVQSAAPESRIVYVDNDPIVLVHARALLTSAPQGMTAYIDADMRDVQGILHAQELTRTFDLSKPVAVSLIAVLQFVTDDAELRRILDEFLAPLPSGSALAVSTVRIESEESRRATAQYNASGIAARARSIAEVTAMFDGLELVEPGVVPVSEWHPDAEAAAVDVEHVYMSGGVAIKR
ncbi:SAM-dependent methyltransferase [Hamadaea tsunoensis]|uniref:SAM-dependent methyltransferase n=1 Tax=Hamadaea tsunoensis TaxID=53368 RepID=UPI000419AF54|nr:SAM-dependent methyltransferase [Hamadaea tsunoensis]